MPVGRYFRGLTAYDLLGNLVPGVIALTVIIGFFPSPPIPSSLGGYGLFVALAFSIGTIIQHHASETVGPRESFDKTLDSVEVLSSLQYRPDESDDLDNPEQSDEPSNAKENSWQFSWWQVCHPFVGPVIGWRRPARGEEMDDVILANRIWTHLVDTYEIPFNTDSYKVLYHVMSSEVDNISSPSRATRMQAIRNFYRGMWITSWYTAVLIIVALLADSQFIVGSQVPLLGVEYRQPAYFAYWTPLWHLGVIALAGIIVFWQLFESMEEDYLEYLFADYAVAIGDNDAISFSEDTELTFSGNLEAIVETDSIVKDENQEKETNERRED